MQTPDYVILGLYLALLAGISWRFRHVSGHPAEFFLAGRSMGALPVGLSVMVTTFSAVNFLALSGEVYGYGLYVLASLPVFFLAAWPVTRFWMPFFLQKRPVSVYAFLEERFDRRVRLFASGLFLVWRLFWMGVALYASCRFVSQLSGLDFTGVLLICGVSAALYSAFGGMRAVVWTDVLQFVVLAGSIVLGVLFACRGGDFWQLLQQSGKLRPFSPADWNYLSPDPCCRISLWSAIIGTFAAFLTRFGADQMVMQRYLAAKSLSAARKGLWINGAASVSALGLLVLFGLAMRVHAVRQGLPEGTPPLRALISLLKSFPPGAMGLLGAGLVAATMSSIDSGLNSCAAAVTMDLLPHRKLPPQLLTLLLALPVLAAALWLFPALNRDHTLFVILNKTVNTIGTPLLGIMLCALFLPGIQSSALLYGSISGTLLTVVFSICCHHLALHYYAVLSLGACGCAIAGFQILSVIRQRFSGPAS